ncbi:MAG: phasin family protein [Burkholderiaceae bacterium]|nr:phasin family protein [Burkholderiaceae bacterium]
MSQKTTAAPWGRIPPALDLRKLIDKLELPEVGRRLVAGQRKDIEALVEANRQAYLALEALGKRQQELLRAAYDAWQTGTREVIAAPDLASKARQSAKRSQQAFSEALADLRDLAEMAVASNRQVLGVLNERAGQRLQEIGLTTGAGKVATEAVADDAPQAQPPSRRRAAAGRTARPPR